MVGPWHALTLRSKGQMLTPTLGNLHLLGFGLHVDMTAHLFSYVCIDC